MVKKLTIKTWISTGLVMLGCLVIAVPMLWLNAPGALEALRGTASLRPDADAVKNYYILSAIGLVLAALALFIFFKQLTNSVRKRVEAYLSAHRDVTEGQLDNDFDGASKIGNVWIGRRWIFSHDLRCILLENADIAWVFSEKEHVKNKVNYYLCLGLASGKIERICVSEEKLQEIMDLYKGFPHILTGNNPEYGYLFKNDRQAFLDMKYRRNTD